MKSEENGKKGKKLESRNWKEEISLRNWKEEVYDTYYYYNVENGRIIGLITPIAHTKIWISKVMTEQYNNDVFLGQYITLDFAKKSIEMYWNIQDRTMIGTVEPI
jgi:hypothetical protein